MKIELPNFENTAEARRFGQFITRDQYLFLAGARESLKRELSEWKNYRTHGSPSDYELTLAFKIQFIREALDVAPDLVLASLIGSGLVTRHSSPVTV